MYNCYVNSISLNSRGSVSYSLNDYYCFLDNRCYSNLNLLKPSHCCVCCANNSVYGVLPICPTFFYGQRQSTLIQCSPSRRLVLGVNRGYSRSRVCDFDSNDSYRNSFTFNESRSVGRKGNSGKVRYGCNVDDVEVILSLLTEDVGDECLGVGKTNEGRERSGSRQKNVTMVQLEESSDSLCKGRKKDTKRGVLGGNSKHEYESLKLQSRKGDMQKTEYRGEEKKESFLKGENRSRLRSQGSNCSSYYSLASSSEFESNSKIHDKRDGFARESSGDYELGESRYDRKASEEVNRKRGYTERHGVVSKKEDNSNSLHTASSNVDFNLRKKSEKKLETELTEQTESWHNSSEKHSRLSNRHESGYRKSFDAMKQYDDEEKTSSLAANIGIKEQWHRQIGPQIGELPEARMKYKQFTEIPHTYDSVVEAAPGYKKLYSDREQDLLGSSSFVQDTGEEQLRTDDFVTEEERQRRNSQELVISSKFEDIDNREIISSHRQSETGMKSLENDATVLPRMVDNLKEQHGQADHQVTGQMGPIGGFQQLTGISNTQNINIQNTFISQNKSDSRVVIQQESSESAGASYPEAIRRTESRKYFQGISSQNDARVGTSFGNQIGSVVKLGEKNKERHNLIDETVMHGGMLTESRRPIRTMSFQGGVTEEPTSSRLSSKLGSQSMVYRIGVYPNDNTSPIATDRAQRHDEPTSLHITDDSHSGSLGSGSSALHVQMIDGSPAWPHEYYGGDGSRTHGDPIKLVSNDDVIGSAARLQQSSTQFVGEFLNKVKHKASTSEVQEGTSQTKLVHEGESRKLKSIGRYSSGDFEQDHDTIRLSQGSRAKGNSDEVRDVTDPSSIQEFRIQESSKTEVPETINTTQNSVVTRTSRSMWNVISDIVRLRWASHSETNNSRSRGKSSPDQSTNSDAWFSGHEPDGNNDETIKQEREVTRHDSSSVDQERHGGIHAHYQGDLSTSKRSKDKLKLVELGLPSSSTTESVSITKGILSHKTEETVSKHSEGSSFGIIEPDSSLPLPAIHMTRSPVVQEISEPKKADTSGGGTLTLSWQPGSTNMTKVSVSEDKTGELKQRKLQRNKQVVRDKFDEWEEAYTFEIEQRKIDEMFMREALLEAKKAADIWEVPVGAVLVQHGKIIARGYNLVEELRDSTAHAEMICIREASNVLRSWRLADTTLYVTLEPCPMCAGAILQARIDTIVWGAPNKLLGADGSWIRLFPSGSEGQGDSGPSDKPSAPVHPFHPNVKLRRGVLASECADAMQQFFQLRRKKKVKKQEPPTPPTPPSCLPISSRPSKFFTEMHDAFHIMFCL